MGIRTSSFFFLLLQESILQKLIIALKLNFQCEMLLVFYDARFTIVFIFRSTAIIKEMYNFPIDKCQYLQTFSRLKSCVILSTCGFYVKNVRTQYNRIV